MTNIYDVYFYVGWVHESETKFVKWIEFGWFDAIICIMDDRWSESDRRTGKGMCWIRVPKMRDQVCTIQLEITPEDWFLSSLSFHHIRSFPEESPFTGTTSNCVGPSHVWDYQSRSISISLIHFWNSMLTYHFQLWSWKIWTHYITYVCTRNAQMILNNTTEEEIMRKIE